MCCIFYIFICLLTVYVAYVYVLFIYSVLYTGVEKWRRHVITPGFCDIAVIIYNPPKPENKSASALRIQYNILVEYITNTNNKDILIVKVKSPSQSYTVDLDGGEHELVTRILQLLSYTTTKIRNSNYSSNSSAKSNPTDSSNNGDSSGSRERFNQARLTYNFTPLTSTTAITPVPLPLFQAPQSIISASHRPILPLTSLALPLASDSGLVDLSNIKRVFEFLFPLAHYSGGIEQPLTLTQLLNSSTNTSTLQQATNNTDAASTAPLPPRRNIWTRCIHRATVKVFTDRARQVSSEGCIQGLKQIEKGHNSDSLYTLRQRLLSIHGVITNSNRNISYNIDSNNSNVAILSSGHNSDSPYLLAHGHFTPGDATLLTNILTYIHRIRLSPLPMLTSSDLTEQDKLHIQEHTVDCYTSGQNDLPPEWSYDGSTFVSFEGSRRLLHPCIDSILAVYIDKVNTDRMEYNKRLEEVMPVLY